MRVRDPHRGFVSGFVLVIRISDAYQGTASQLAEKVVEESGFAREMHSKS